MCRMSSLRSGSRRRGLTRVELLVVLTILIAVAGIVIPLLPNVLSRTQEATDATQITELARAIQAYQTAYGGYPQDFDLLTDGTTGFPTLTTPTSTATTYLPVPTTGPQAGVPLGGYAVAGPLVASELAALFNAGIQYVQPMTDATVSATGTSPANFQATLNPYAATTLIVNRIDLSTSPTSVMFAVIGPSTITGVIWPQNPSFLQVSYAADPTARYVLFGIGSRCSMVGKTMQEAPLSSPINRLASPANTYFRYGAIFKVSGTEINGSGGAPGTGAARLIAIVAMETGTLQTAEQNIVNFNGQAQN
jgi:type II secretory pathway pseudopilin PulG